MINPDNLFGRLGNRMFQMAYIYAQVKRGNIPDIYLQDPRYFDQYEKEIKALFGQDITPINQIAIHVRRGDYVKNRFYVDLTETTYYDEAIKQFPEESFLVFSDDIDCCKEYFKGYEFDYCDETDPVKSMNMMAGCKGHIIANSSFSWWGAYISPFTKKVIAPKQWYSDGEIRTKCPNNWIKI